MLTLSWTVLYLPSFKLSSGKYAEFFNYVILPFSSFIWSVNLLLSYSWFFIFDSYSLILIYCSLIFVSIFHFSLLKSVTYLISFVILLFADASSYDSYSFLILSLWVILILYYSIYLANDCRSSTTFWEFLVSSYDICNFSCLVASSVICLRSIYDRFYTMFVFVFVLIIAVGMVEDGDSKGESLGSFDFSWASYQLSWLISYCNLVLSSYIFPIYSKARSYLLFRTAISLVLSTLVCTTLTAFYN